MRYYDPELKPEKDVLYVESIAIKPKERNLKLFFELLKTFKEETEKRGYKKIACHVRISNNLSSFLQKRGAKKLRTIENWHNFGEPFDYLEIEIEKKHYRYLNLISNMRGKLLLAGPSSFHFI